MAGRYSEAGGDQDLPGVERRLDQRAPAGRLSHHGGQGQGTQGDQRRYEEGEDHEEALVHVECLGLTFPVHHDRPYPATQNKRAHRRGDDPLALVDPRRGRLAPHRDQQGENPARYRSRDHGSGSARDLHRGPGRSQFHAELFQADPFQADPFHAEPAQPASFQARPFQARPFQAAPAQSPSFHARPSHTQPFQSAPFHAQPDHVESSDGPCGKEIPDHRLAFHVSAGPVGDSWTVVPSRIASRLPADWLRFIGPAVAAAWALRAPWPSTKGLPTGPRLVVPSRRALSWFGVRPGLPARTSAAAPLVMAELNDVPEPTKLADPTRAEG